jgi:hypothetical protein
VADLSRDAKAGLGPAGGNQLPPVLEGAAPLTAACPSLEGRAGNAGIDWPLRKAKDEGPDPGQKRSPLPHSPETAPCAELP